MSDIPSPAAEPEGLPAEQNEAEEQYEGTAEELTGFSPDRSIPGVTWFNRKRVMITVCSVFSAIVITGLVFTTSKSRREAEENASGYAAVAPRDFLERERARSRNRPPEAETEDEEDEPAVLPETESGLPEVTRVALNEPPPNTPPHMEQEVTSGGTAPPPFVPYFSPLVPQIEGSLFSSGASQGNAAPPSSGAYPSGDPRQSAMEYLDRLNQAAGQAAGSPLQDSYAAQNNQENKNTFYAAESGGTLSGNFLQKDILWIGTMIPAVLETAVNTDLPGNVIARVTENVYDSHTGKKVLIPQGTLLVARYNNSVSYAQKRVQIVWDTLIRPDGYQLELGGMNGVDPQGMAGLKAVYRENWFEYLKAAGIVTMFSLANSKMAAAAAQYGSGDTAGAVISSNSQFMNQMNGGIVGRAMNIQPTLTVESGETIMIMLNKNVYLPAMPPVPVTQKYILD